MKQTLFLSLLVFLFASCAIHQPMSEMVMFQQKKALDDSSYYSKYSHSISSINTDLFLESEVVKYTRDNNSSDKKNGYGNPASFTTNLIFLSPKHKRIGYSFAVEPLIYGSGIDATINIFGQYYFTTAVGMARDMRDPQYLFILQRRLINGNPTGLSIGAVFRRRFRYDGVDVNYITSNNPGFNTTSFGLRTVFTYSPITEYGSSRLFIHSTGSLNYDLTLNAFYPKLGISIGVF